MVHLATVFNVSIQAMSRALGTALVTTLAVATMVWSMISVKWGKRPVYLASTLFMLAGSLLAGEGESLPHVIFSSLSLFVIMFQQTPTMFSSVCSLRVILTISHSLSFRRCSDFTRCWTSRTGILGGKLPSRDLFPS